MSPQEQYLAALPTDGSEVKHDDIYWQLRQAGNHQAAAAMHDLRRAGKINTHVVRVDGETVLYVSRPVQEG